MPRTKKETADETVGEEVHINGAPLGEAAPADDGEITIPPRLNAEVLPNVEAAAQTITGCSDAEMKNFLATADYVCRQISLQFAELWKQVCKEARANAVDGEKAAKVSLAVKVQIDHSSLLLMDTKVDTTLPRQKIKVSGETQENLTQTEFSLKA